MDSKKLMTEEKIPFVGSMKVPDGEIEEAFFAIYPDFFTKTLLP